MNPASPNADDLGLERFSTGGGSTSQRPLVPEPADGLTTSPRPGHTRVDLDSVGWARFSDVGAWGQSRARAVAPTRIVRCRGLQQRAAGWIGSWLY
jgi:hypothetical protein